MNSTGTPAPKKALTARQKRFVEEYLIDLNAVQAYFRAYGRWRTNAAGKPVRRPYRSASVMAARLLENVEITAELAAARRQISRRTRIQADRICRELAYIAFADPIDVTDPETNVPLPFAEMDPHARRAVASVETEVRTEPDGAGEVEKCKLKFWDKLGALDKLMKHLGMYSENNALEDILGQLPGALREQVVAALSQAGRDQGRA